MLDLNIFLSTRFFLFEVLSFVALTNIVFIGTCLPRLHSPLVSGPAFIAFGQINWLTFLLIDYLSYPLWFQAAVCLQEDRASSVTYHQLTKQHHQQQQKRTNGLSSITSPIHMTLVCTTCTTMKTLPLALSLKGTQQSSVSHHHACCNGCNSNRDAVSSNYFNHILVHANNRQWCH